MAKASKKAVKKAAPVKKPTIQVEIIPNKVKPTVKPDKPKKSFRQFISKGKYDQNGEFGVLTEAIKRIGLKAITAVEFGAPTTTYCSNIAELDVPVRYYFDNDPKEACIIRATITKDNVNDLIPECDVLSIDIDGNDYEVWEAYKHEPAIVIIEINSSIKPDADAPVNDPWNGTGYKPMKELGESKGYFLLVHTGNLIFIKNEYKDLFNDADPSFMTDWL